MPNKQAYPKCENECSNPTIYTNQNVRLCALNWEEEQMPRKIREQRAFKPEDTILLYSPGIRRLVKVNWTGEGRTFPHWYLRTSGGKACQSTLPLVSTAADLLQGGSGAPALLGPGAGDEPDQWQQAHLKGQVRTHTQHTKAKEIHLELKLYLKPSKRQRSRQSWGQFQMQPYQHFLWNDN